MKAIYIPHLLNISNRTERLQIEDYIGSLDTLTPVRGTLTVVHCGTYLEVSAKADAIATLTCDRSLKQYNHRLAIDTRELIWLADEPDTPEKGGTEREVPVQDLTETLSPNGVFDPEMWLYEQFCLALPMRQVGDDRSDVDYGYRDEPLSDSRWSALEQLKKQLNS